ncbi:hypothetical protein EVAR_12256_1 [Eumeta japonica]|uniref:Uncharacterized protein n=1 Tax=Eumeta variegata TaxID=151549 RepID=A0A4C1TU49_EUMVA|nr:hypothetical protein EVAR_12256_1 [Eumeta japonica]
MQKDFRQEDGRAKRKRLAVILPILTLVAAAKTKLLLIPVLLTVLFIKKLLLLAALLLPSLLNTLKACKLHHGPSFFSQWGSSDSSDYNSDYGNSFSYSSNSNYGKDWASNRAYNVQKPRPTPMYITAPGAAVA